MPDTTYHYNTEWWGRETVRDNIFLPVTGDTAVYGMEPDVLPSRSFFPGHTGTGRLEPSLREVASYDWAFFLIVMLLFLFAALRYTYPKRISSLFSAIFSKTAASQMLREYNIVNSQLFLPLFLIYITSVSLFSYLVIERFSDHALIQTLPAWQAMIILFSGHVIFMLLKVFMLNFSGWIFGTKQVTNEYIHNLFLFNFFAGIILIPFILLVIYSNLQIFIIAALAGVFLVFITRFLRGFMIGLTNTQFSIFHLFLYLCTLEILPLAVIAKLALRYV